MPGLTASPEDAAEIASLLDEIGIDRIELHHYRRSDRRAAMLIQRMDLNTVVAGWCRAVKDDINDAISCGFEEVGISHPVSRIRFRAKWPDWTEDELLERVVSVVEYAAKDQGLRVFVHGEDSTRADWES